MENPWKPCYDLSMSVTRAILQQHHLGDVLSWDTPAHESWAFATHHDPGGEQVHCEVNMSAKQCKWPLYSKQLSSDLCRVCGNLHIKLVDMEWTACGAAANQIMKL